MDNLSQISFKIIPFVKKLYFKDFLNFNFSKNFIDFFENF